MNASSTRIPAASPLRGHLHTDTSPWYRQFWPWFLIALPAISVAFSFATLFIAMNDADAVVPHEGDSSSYAAPRAPAAGLEAVKSLPPAGDVESVRAPVPTEQPER